MIYVQKKLANEPISLVKHRSTPGAIYNDCNKEDIRKALLLEQGYLCAYCMRRINNGKNQKGSPNTRIEHFETQGKHIGLSMNYMNMLGVCDGNEGNPKRLLHCDKSRTLDQQLNIDPRNKNCNQLIKYTPSGHIESDNAAINNDLNKELNLNNQRFVFNRKSAIDTAILAIQKNYKKKKDGSWKKSDLQKELNYWTTKNNERFQEYCGAVIYYLERKLARL